MAGTVHLVCFILLTVRGQGTVGHTVMRAAVDDHKLDGPVTISVGVALRLDQSLHNILKLRHIIRGDLGPSAAITPPAVLQEVIYFSPEILIHNRSPILRRTTVLCAAM